MYVDSGFYLLESDVSLTSNDSGSSAAPVSIIGSRGLTVFERSGTTGRCMNNSGMKYGLIEGFEFRGGGSSAISLLTNSDYTTLVGNLFRESGVFAYRGNVTLTGNTFWHCDYTTEGSNNVVKNNIFVASGAGSFCVEHIDSFGIPTAFTNIFDYNCYHATDGATTGYAATVDLHPVIADPLLVDPMNGNFHLQSTTGSWHDGTFLADAADSPCIDAGTAMGPGVKDFDGRAIARPDIGAFEFGPKP